ncbi:MAG: hypothetical protein IJX67_06020 [Oscillospiraceae bacterium]|nr:hypothetical protein [Oscillospiraceae bacterium]
MEIDRPPETYRQWLDCLQHLTEHPTDRRVLELIAGGTLGGPPSEQFIARVSDTVSTLLTHCCRDFLRRLDETLAEGDSDTVLTLAVRFRRNANACLFYRTLTFLPEPEVQMLEDGFTEQLQSFWNNFLRQVRITARDSMDPRTEDMAYELGRVKILTEWRRTAP